MCILWKTKGETCFFFKNVLSWQLVLWERLYEKTGMDI